MTFIEGMGRRIKKLPINACSQRFCDCECCGLFWEVVLQTCLLIWFGCIFGHLNFEHTKIGFFSNKKHTQIFLDTFYGSFVFQSRICPIVGFWWHMCKSRDILCRFLYCTLCSLGAEFSGNSKPGLYFCCTHKHSLFSGSHVEIIFTENKTKCKRNENTLAFGKVLQFFF